MKKTLVRLLTLCLLIPLSACGDAVIEGPDTSPTETDAPPVTAAPFEVELDSLTGIWYKDGQVGDAHTKLIIDGDSYYTEIMGSASDGAGICVSSLSADYIGLAYAGPVLELEQMIGIISPNLWILDEGRVLYDEFFNHYYLKADISAEEQTHLCAKYSIIRDAWRSKTDTKVLDFAFDGSLSLIPGDGISPTVMLGSWTLQDGVILLRHTDGTTQELPDADEITVNFCGATFVREEDW